jgi:hypothetical protein
MNIFGEKQTFIILIKYYDSNCIYHFEGGLYNTFEIAKTEAISILKRTENKDCHCLICKTIAITKQNIDTITKIFPE